MLAGDWYDSDERYWLDNAAPRKLIPHYWALCQENPPEPVYSTHKGPVMRCFDVFFVVSPKKLFRDVMAFMWCHFNVYVVNNEQHSTKNTVYHVGGVLIGWRSILHQLCTEVWPYHRLIWNCTYRVSSNLNPTMTRESIPLTLYYKTHLCMHWNCWPLRCSWSIACRRCSNYIFILDLTPGFSGLGRDNCKTRRETFKLWIRCVLY